MRSGRVGLSRRELLAALGAITAGGWGARPAQAESLAPLRGKELLPAPDFSALRAEQPFVVGVRPHRTGGVRLELEPPIEVGAAKRHLVHNYGHGGGGITLSWGSAARVVELLEPLMGAASGAPTSVAVVGTGVIGLTTATELLRRWPALHVRLYARDLALTSTTSWIAGGQFEPSGISLEYGTAERKAELATLLRRSRDRIVGLQRSGRREAYGVAERKNYTLDHPVRAFEEFTPADVVPKPRRGLLPFEKLRVPGREYSTWLMNPMLLLPTLAAELKAAGVEFVKREFASRQELLALPEEVVVNCTGLGAKQLTGDSHLVPMRGHLAVLQRTDPRQFWLFSGGCGDHAISYVFCRQTDIVIGGTVQTGNGSMELGPADEAVFARLLTNARTLFSGNPEGCRRDEP